MHEWKDLELACTHQPVQRSTTFPGSRRTVRSDPSTAIKLQSTYQTESDTAPSQGQPVYVRSTFHNMLLLTATQSPKRNWPKDRSYHTRQEQSADSRGALASFAALVTALSVVAASCPLLGRRFRRSIGLGRRLRLRLLFGQQGTQCALHFRCLL